MDKEEHNARAAKQLRQLEEDVQFTWRVLHRYLHVRKTVREKLDRELIYGGKNVSTLIPTVDKDMNVCLSLFFDSEMRVVCLKITSIGMLKFLKDYMLATDEEIEDIRNRVVKSIEE